MSSHSVPLTLLPRECRLLWRDYHNSVRLIVVVPLDRWVKLLLCTVVPTCRKSVRS